MRKKQIIRIAIVAALVLISACFAIFLLPNLLNNKQEPTQEVVVEKSNEIEIINDQWPVNYEINNDYLGNIYFESGLFNLPFVQGDSNETYYRNNWETLAYDEEGSIFLDFRNDINKDQNIIIYGHTVMKSYPLYETCKDDMFSPLHKLKEKSNYEDNKYFYLNLEKSVEKYEVALIFRCKIDESDDGQQFIIPEEPAYYYTNYSQEEFDEYIKLAKERQYYDTGVTIDSKDKMVTLQTCLEGSPDKLIVVGKLIDSQNKKVS